MNKERESTQILPEWLWTLVIMKMAVCGLRETLHLQHLCAAAIIVTDCDPSTGNSKREQLSIQSILFATQGDTLLKERKPFPAFSFIFAKLLCACNQNSTQSYLVPLDFYKYFALALNNTTPEDLTWIMSCFEQKKQKVKLKYPDLNFKAIVSHSLQIFRMCF